MGSQLPTEQMLLSHLPDSMPTDIQRDDDDEPEDGEAQ